MTDEKGPSVVVTVCVDKTAVDGWEQSEKPGQQRRNIRARTRLGSRWTDPQSRRYSRAERTACLSLVTGRRATLRVLTASALHGFEVVAVGLR